MAGDKLGGVRFRALIFFLAVLVLLADSVNAQKPRRANPKPDTSSWTVMDCEKATMNCGSSGPLFTLTTEPPVLTFGGDPDELSKQFSDVCYDNKCVPTRDVLAWLKANGKER